MPRNHLNLQGRTAADIDGLPNLAPLGEAVVYFDHAAGTLKMSVSGSPYEDVRPAGAGGFGAVGDGVTDDTLALAAAIDALPAAGGTILIPANFSMLLTAGVTTGTKPVIFQGQGLSSKIIGSGFTILTLAKDKCGLRDLQIVDPNGDADTIAVDINNGSAGVDDWFLENVFLTGTNKLGIGLRQEFALKGHVLGGEIRLFDHGVEPNNNGALRSNANHYSGVKIRENAVGVFIGADDIDSIFFTGCTIEGNPIGISQASGKVSVTTTHFEATGGATPTNVSVSAGNFISSGCGFFGAGGIRDVVVTAGAGVHASTGDNFASGITHGGTGVYVVNAVTTSLTTAGDGPIQQWGGSGIVGAAGASGTNFVATGYNAFNFLNPLIIGLSSDAISQVYTGLTTWDPGDIADGAVASTTVTVPNAAIGDQVILAFHQAVPAGAFMVGHVTSPDTVSITLANFTGSNLDLANGNLRATVIRMNA